jgi:hypothetical protein
VSNPWDNDPVVDRFDAALAAEGVTGKLADVARSIYAQESSRGANTRTSNAGAVGPMQILPATFNGVADRGWDIRNPDQNLRAGIRYVKLLERKAGGDPALIAAGYYGGPGAIDKARAGVAVSDPRNPSAPNTLQYGNEVAARVGGNPWDKDPIVAPARAPATAQVPPMNVDPTEGMSWGEKAAAGAGKAVYDVVRGVGQFIPTDLSGNTLVSRADVAESRARDAALMATGGGKVGNVAGNLALLAPTAFIPGAATIPGAAAIGAVTGAAAPSTSTGETVRNALMGGVAGPVAIGAGRVLAAGYQGARALLAPFTERGRQGIVNDVLQRSATDPQAATNALLRARPVVAGSEPTVAQAAADPGLAQLERTVLANPEMAGPLQQRFATQRAARRAAVQDVAGQPGHLEAIQEGRRIFARQDYADAIRQGADPAMAEAMAPQIESLLRRPSIQRAQEVARNLAAENDHTLTNFNSVEGLDWLKKALDNQISTARGPNSSIGTAELQALEQTRGDLMRTLEQIAPGYAEANRSYAAMSRQVNGLDVGRQLEQKLYKPGTQYDVPGFEREAGAAYQRALAEGVDNVRLSNGMERPLHEVLPTADIAQLEGVATDLGRVRFAQSEGRGVGSPTAQNMVSQNLLRRSLGPTGLPESWTESVALNSLLRPYQWLMRTAEPRIQRVLGETMTDPAAAAAALQGNLPAAATRGGRALQYLGDAADRFGLAAAPYLPGYGLNPLLLTNAQRRE